MSQFTISSGSKSYTFEITSEVNDQGQNKVVKVTYNGTELELDNFWEFYTYVCRSRLRERIEDGAQPAGDPILTYKFEFADSEREADVVNFYENSSRRCFIEVNGVCNYYDYKTYVDKMLEDMDKVIAGETITEYN